MATAGLSDIHPISWLGKGYVVVWLILFTSLEFARILSQYAELNLKERELTLAKRLLKSDIGEEMFIEIDVDQDGKLSENEC